MKRIVIFIGLLSCAPAAGADEMQISMTAEQIDNLAIKVASLQASRQVPALSAPATVAVPTDRELLLTAPQPGLLTRLHVNIGDKVESGQTLAQIHSPELVGLQQQFLTARSALHLAELERNRDQKLFDAGVVAERRWQETQALYASKAAVADESRQLLSMAGMSTREIDALAKTHRLSSTLTIKAPIAGTVLDRFATLGSRLDIQAPLYRLADLSQLWLEIYLPQERGGGIQVGDRVQITGTQQFGSISFVGRSVDPDSQTLLARAVVEGDAGQLKVSQRLNVEVLQQALSPGFNVPNTALAQNAGRSYVFVRNADGFAVTPVEIVGKRENASLIKGPLTEQQSIAVQGAVALKATWLGLGGDD
ncbi:MULTISPECIES: efflux RND transporter periplasmic adaptor subunit [Methylomonas]|uniref:efflux RND transporter periplasmic adaptor subunit n=1 Tax=Methylomonas TaxID=416 RepID=UPI001231954D|nr:efflux RND transporter periplasmic adaptor subunit [Methylomonas rhizoryzae]